MSGNHLSTIELLLDQGAMIEKASLVGKTPLHRACEYGHVESVKLLLSKNADSSKRDDQGRGALHYASLSRNIVSEGRVGKGACVCFDVFQLSFNLVCFLGTCYSPPELRS